MRSRLPWWKWLAALILSPISVVAGVAKFVADEVPQAYKDWWRHRPFGGE